MLTVWQLRVGGLTWQEQAVGDYQDKFYQDKFYTVWGGLTGQELAPVGDFYDKFY